MTKKTQEETEDSQKGRLLQALLDNIPDTIYFKDEDAQFIEVSESKAEEVGEEDRDSMKGKTDFEHFSVDEAKKSYEDDMRVIEEEEPVIQREEKKTVGDDEKWFSTTKVPRYDEEGNVIGILGISRDITERKESEEKASLLHSLLRHDLGNKSLIIKRYLKLLEDSDLSEEQEETLKKAKKGVKDCIDLIEKVSSLRKIESEESIKEVSLLPKITNVIGGLKEQAEESGIEIEFEENEVSVKGGPLLEELFSNLIENSIKHSGCSKLRISIHEEDEECIVIIEDDGKGIPDDMKEKIFEKRFKKGEKAGSGLGMTLVNRIAEEYGGKIEVKDSELGGARFDVHLEKAES